MKKTMATLALVFCAVNAHAFDTLSCSDGFRSATINGTTLESKFAGLEMFGIQSNQNYICTPTSAVGAVAIYSCNKGGQSFAVTVTNTFGVVSLQVQSKVGIPVFNGVCLVKYHDSEDAF